MIGILADRHSRHSSASVCACYWAATVCTLREPTASDKRCWSDKIMNLHKSTMNQLSTYTCWLKYCGGTTLFYEITDGQHVSRSAHGVLCSFTFGLDAVRQRKLRLPEVRPRLWIARPYLTIRRHRNITDVRCGRTVPYHQFGVCVWGGVRGVSS